MVLAPFYQDFMKSLDEHINELVEGTLKFELFSMKYKLRDAVDLYLCVGLQSEVRTY